MTWLLEIYAALYAGFGFLANNYADCSSTELLQLALLGTGIAGVMRIALRAVGSAQMRKRLTAVDLTANATIATALRRAHRNAATDRPVAAYWSPDNGPRLATLGYFRPCLIIGRNIADALGPEELEAALTHELQHARRRDALRIDLGRAGFGFALLATIFAVILFLAFYVGALEMNRPVAVTAIAGGLVLVALAGRKLTHRLERAAEFACDRAAAAGRGGALAAAAALVKVARLEKATVRHGSLAMVPLFSPPTFQLRVEKLIDAARGPHPVSRPRADLRFALVAVVAMLAGVAQTPDLRRGAESGCVTCALVIEKSQRW